MKDIINVHPSIDLLENYSMNRLPERQTAYVEEHMLLCSHCCDALTALEQEISLMRLVLAVSEPKPVFRV